MICPECKSKFTYSDRIKSMSRNNCKIQCRNCKNIFIRKNNSGMLVNSLVTGLLVSISFLIGSSIGKTYFDNSILFPLMLSIAIVFILFIFNFISQNLWEYEVCNEDLKE